MSDKYSSDNKMRKLFEGFRGFAEEEPTVNEGSMKEMAIDVMNELQGIMERYGLGVEDLQGILQDMDPELSMMNEGEGFMAALQNFIGMAPKSELEKAKAELERVLANIDKTDDAMDKELNPIRQRFGKSSQSDETRTAAKLAAKEKLAQMKAQRGIALQEKKKK